MHAWAWAGRADSSEWRQRHRVRGGHAKGHIQLRMNNKSARLTVTSSVAVAVASSVAVAVASSVERMRWTVPAVLAVLALSRCVDSGNSTAVSCSSDFSPESANGDLVIYAYLKLQTHASVLHAHMRTCLRHAHHVNAVSVYALE
jgi:hypothetical protein